MIPILYAPNETNFNNNGLGLLYDCIEATVTEERNGQFELSFVYPTTGIHFSEIQDDSFVKAIPGDGEEEQLFRVYYHSKPIGGKVEYKAEHVSYQLKFIPVSPYTASTAISAMEGIADNACENCPFEFWTDVATAGDFKLESPASGRSVLGGMEGSILDIYGGEYKWDNYLVRLYVQRGSDRGVTLRYGKNITDIRQERNIAETVTGVMPFWTGESEDVQLYVELPEKVVHGDKANNFPFKRTITLDCSGDFSEPPSEAALREAAQRYLSQPGIGVPNVNITVSFVALWQTEEYKDIANLERVKLCDTVTVYFEPLDISAQAKVIRTDYDVLKERYASIELGDARSNFTSEVRADIAANSAEIIKRTVSPSYLQKAIDRATELIRGGLGGYVVFTTNADGEPQEITIMNTPDVQTATQCIRINKNGIGFSLTGYDGPYTSAWTIDGHFNADFITAGYLNANRIKGGTLTLGGTGNGNGVLEVYSASNQQIGSWDKDGLSAIGRLTIKDGDVYTKIEPLQRAELSRRLNTQYITWYNSIGLSVYKETNGNVPSKITFFPLSNSLEEQVICDKFEKTIIFPDDDSNGYAYFLEMDKNSFYFTGNDYGNGSASTPYHIEMDDDGTSIGTTGYTICAEEWSSTCHQILLCANASGGHAGYNTNAPVLIFLGDDTSTQNMNGIHLKAGSDYIKIRQGYLVGDSHDLSYKGQKLAYDSSSSVRYKHDIKPIEDAELDPHKLLNLPVVQFQWNTDHALQYKDMKGKTIPGIIAEDVEKIYPSATIHNEDGKVESWDERRIIPGMLALIQEQDKKIKSLEARLAKLEELLK